MSPDLEQFSLRTFLGSLRSEEFECRSDEIHLGHIAEHLEGNAKAVLFEHVIGSEVPVCGNVAGSRSRLARAFETDTANLAKVVLNRLKGKPNVVEVDRSAAPVQQVVLTGDQVDLTALPVHFQHELDGAPYISASVDISRDPQTGWTNVGMRRLMLRGQRTAGVDVVAPSDLRAIYQGHVARGEPMPIAFAIGSHPVDHIAATLRLPMDELGLMAMLRGQPIGVVRCITNDLLVPADAQYIIEGFLDPAGYVEPEGPYGEFLGYYGALKRNPLLHVTAVTHRSDPIFQTATIGGRSMACTDTAQLCSLRTELLVWRCLESAVRDVAAVYAPPSTGGTFQARIAMRQRVPGEARNAILAVLASQANVKQVVVVDPDIDIFSNDQMDWAMATRFQPAQDLVVPEGLRAMPLDPSLGQQTVTSKIGFDLTMPFRPIGSALPQEFLVPEPPRWRGARFDTLVDALRDGPKHFHELMSAVGSLDGREIVRWLEGIGVTRTDDGRYQLARDDSL